MRTWATIFNALSRSEISAQLRDSHMHIIEQNKSWMTPESTKQSINHKISYVGPPPKPISIFAWINSINSIIRNYGIRFMLILKRFKIMELGKLFARKKNSNKTLLKVDFWKLIKMGRMKNLGDLKLFQNRSFQKKCANQGSRNHLQVESMQRWTQGGMMLGRGYKSTQIGNLNHVNAWRQISMRRFQHHCPQFVLRRSNRREHGRIFLYVRGPTICCKTTVDYSPILLIGCRAFILLLKKTSTTLTNGVSLTSFMLRQNSDISSSHSEFRHLSTSILGVAFLWHNPTLLSTHIWIWLRLSKMLHGEIP